MKKPNRGWLALTTAVAMLVVLSCGGGSDEVTNVPVDQAVEAGLNPALQKAVVPLVTFYGALGTLLSTRAQTRAGTGLGCPDTSGWCASGTVTCSVTQTGLAFDWDECMVLTGDAPITIDGNIDVIPGTQIGLTLTNLFINNNPAMSGTGSIDIAACNYFINVHTADASVNGLITMCDTDQYPTGESLVVTFGPFMVTILLDGSSVANATAMRAGTPVAFCTIDLDSDPLTSSCNAY